MKIAFVPAARLLSDVEPNGEGLIAVDLIRRLARRGHEVVAWCERAQLSEDIEGVQIREVPAEGRTVALGRMAFAARIAAEASRKRFDVAHLLFPFTTHTGYTRMRGAPLIVGPVNLPWPGGERRSARALARVTQAFTRRAESRLHARTLSHAARILVTGPSSRDALPDRVRDRCVNVPFGVDVDRFPAQPIPSSPTILFCATLAERKGAAVLIRAMHRVVSNVPNARLVVAGSDPDGKRTYLERLAETIGVAASVSFVGSIPPEEVPALHGRARVFCAPSFGEPFGMNIVEAMSSGRAVVATLGGGIGDAVEHGRGGLLVPQGDHNALADALIDVLTTPGQAEAMGAYNRARAERHYAIELVVDRIEAVYHDVTGVARHARGALNGASNGA